MTAPLALSGYITRTALSLSNLDLFTADPAGDPTVPMIDLVQDGLTPGGAPKRRQVAESMYVDDAFQLQSSKGRTQGQFSFFVTGHDGASLQTNIGDLLAAVDQPQWNLHVSIGGADWAWSCWDADLPVVGFPVSAFYGLWAPVTVPVLRSPIPVAGPL